MICKIGTHYLRILFIIYCTSFVCIYYYYCLYILMLSLQLPSLKFDFLEKKKNNIILKKGLAIIVFAVKTLHRFYFCNLIFVNLNFTIFTSNLLFVRRTFFPDMTGGRRRHRLCIGDKYQPSSRVYLQQLTRASLNRPPRA